MSRLVPSLHPIFILKSKSLQKWRRQLSNRGYHVGHFILNPTQVAIPNDRPRYYCVAVMLQHSSSNNDDLRSDENYNNDKDNSLVGNCNINNDTLNNKKDTKFLSSLYLSRENKEEEEEEKGEEEEIRKERTLRRDKKANSLERGNNNNHHNNNTDNFQSSPSLIHTDISPLGVLSSEKLQQAENRNFIAPISDFLINDNNSNNNNEQLIVPESVLKRDASWCFDIVTPSDRRSACFTSSYGRYVRGTGSVLYTGDDEFEKEVEEVKKMKKQKEGKEKEEEEALMSKVVEIQNDEEKINENGHSVSTKQTIFPLISPNERTFDKDWLSHRISNFSSKNLRYFSGMEMSKLFGFSSFQFPTLDKCNERQRRKLMGNSLNVRVASRVAEIGLRGLFFSK